MVFNERLHRIFREDRRALNVPIDHTPVEGFMTGWEDPERTLEQIVEGGADAVMSTYGILKHYRPLLQGRIPMILRLDGGPTVFSEQWPNYSQWHLLYTVEDALRLGCDGVIVMGFFGSTVEMDTLKIMTGVAVDCEKWEVPLAVEALPCAGPNVPDIYAPDKVALASRISAEFGADYIKTYYTGSAESFRFVTSRCPVPVLMAGGSKAATEREFFEVVKGMLGGGGAGMWCGRNVWQHDRPAAMVRALVRIIHENASVEEALAELGAGD